LNLDLEPLFRLVQLFLGCLSPFSRSFSLQQYGTGTFKKKLPVPVLEVLYSHRNITTKQEKQNYKINVKDCGAQGKIFF